jgi:NTP pyrophosphatase (non-canonical NTP hydrolase)
MSKYEFAGYLADACHDIADWREAKGFETNWYNVPKKLMLLVTELSEAMEAYRTLSPDTLDGLQKIVADEDSDVIGTTVYAGVENFKEELADVAIRLFDLAGSLRIDLEGAIRKKMAFNETRPHKHGKEC